LSSRHPVEDIGALSLYHRCRDRFRVPVIVNPIAGTSGMDADEAVIGAHERDTAPVSLATGPGPAHP